MGPKKRRRNPTPRPRPRRAPVRLIVRIAAVGALLVGFGSFPGQAETTTTSSTPESTDTTDASTTSSETTSTTAAPTSTTGATETTAAGGDTTTTSAMTADEQQAERERIEAAEAAKAREVDAANAQLSDVTEALRVLQERVEAQAGRVDYANERLVEAEESLSATSAEVEAAEGEIDELETRLSDQAIRTFMGDDSDQVVLANVPDPNEALRRQTMLAQATQTDIDLVGELRAAREDLDVRRAEALDAAEAAEAFRTEAEEQLETLRADRAAQGQATAAAEQRLDHLLAERAALAALGEEAAAGSDVEDALVDQLASSPPPPAPTTSVTPPDTIGEEDIEYAGNGIYVHRDIVDAVRQLLADSAAAGINLAGGGYRSPESQIAVRRNNCGTSAYAIYEMPASQCSPPTARPGRSMHEQGKAIDFTYNGQLIRSRSGAGWAWLRDNAARYGLQNLPSEPWHWSTNGR